MLPQITEPAFQFEPLVDQVIAIPHSLAMEQLRLAIIRIPAAMPNPPSEEMAFAGDVISVILRGRDFAANLRSQFRRAALIRIDAQHPMMTGGVQRHVAQLTEALEC